jgi:DNA ligase (NAD+)
VADLTWPKQRKGKDGEMIDVSFGRRNAENLIAGIDASRDRGLSRVLASISIRHVGPRVAKLITQRYPTIDKLMNASVEQLASIHEIGDAIAASVSEFCHSPHGQRIFRELAEVGVKLEQPHSGSDSSARILDGKSIVVTGTLQHFTRDEIQSLIEKLGGRASSSVSKNTDFVVAGDKAGSKLAKAQQLGVQVISESEFKQLAGL